MKKIYLLLLSVLTMGIVVRANPGDTTWVQVNSVNFDHNGYFDVEAAFPDGSVTYRKILMILTLSQYDCDPGDQYCHQWDYDIENYVMTPDGDTFEIARMVTPFATSGWNRFGASWQQPYAFDVTDYALYLKNNVSIRSNYSGYSWGFHGDIKFAFIEGVPERDVVKIDNMYKGYFRYGDASNPINNNLSVKNYTSPTGTDNAAMKIFITGHGADNNGQCCEFDEHSYQLMLNGSAIATKLVWKDDCGLNNLYPQGGTWVHDRSNWCPGESITPIYHKLIGITAGSNFNTNMAFEDYTATANFGSYKIESQIVYYGNYNKSVDASLDEIIAPTNYPDNYRENPSANIPMIQIHNSGSTPISSVEIQYGVKDSIPQQYTWNGTLAPLSDTIISLPALTTLENIAKSSASGNFQFIATIINVNGSTDEDATNDTLRSTFMAAPTWPGQFIVKLHPGNIGKNGRINFSPAQGSWVITDAGGNTIAGQENADVNVDYNDTINITNPGFYRLKIANNAKDSVGFCFGLHWWALEQNGLQSGALWVKDIAGANIPMHGYTYAGSNLEDGGQHDDFGCEFIQYFYVTTPSVSVNDIKLSQKINIFPNPANTEVNLSIESSLTDALNVTMINTLGQTVYEHQNVKKFLTISTVELPAGIYSIICTSGNSKSVQKIVITH